MTILVKYLQILVTTAFEQAVHILDGTTYEPLVDVKGITNGLGAARSALYGTNIVPDKTGRRLLVLNDELKEQRQLDNKNELIEAFQMFNQSTMLVTAGSSGSLRLFDYANGGLLRETVVGSVSVNDVYISSNDAFVVTGDERGAARIHSAVDLTLLCELSGHLNAVRVVTMLPDNETALTASLDGSIKVWSRKTAKCKITLTSNTTSVTCMAVSRSSKMFASANKDGTVVIWNSVSFQPHHTIKCNEHVARISFVGRKDSTELIASVRKVGVEVINVQTGKIVERAASIATSIHTHAAGKTMLFFLFCFPWKSPCRR